MTSFAELEQQEMVPADEIIETLRDYTQGGWAILADVVVDLIERASPPLTWKQIDEVRRLGEEGAFRQGGPQTIEGNEYAQIADIAHTMLHSIPER